MLCLALHRAATCLCPPPAMRSCHVCRCRLLRGQWHEEPQQHSALHTLVSLRAVGDGVAAGWDGGWDLTKSTCIATDTIACHCTLLDQHTGAMTLPPTWQQILRTPALERGYGLGMHMTSSSGIQTAARQVLSCPVRGTEWHLWKGHAAIQLDTARRLMSEQLISVLMARCRPTPGAPPSSPRQPASSRGRGSIQTAARHPTWPCARCPSLSTPALLRRPRVLRL